MGLRKMFHKKKEELSYEQAQEVLRNNGVPVKEQSNYNKYSKFAEFNDFAKEKSEAQRNNPLKPRLAGGAAAVVTSTDDATSSNATANDPYSTDNATSNTSTTAYDPYATQEQTQVYKTQTQTETSTTGDQDLDLNDYPGAAAQQEQAYDPYSDAYQPQEEELTEEEQEIRRITRQTKDVRGETTQSTARIVNILSQTRDSGANTIGVLGSQNDKLHKIESGMNEMESNQYYIDGHVKELERAQHMVHAPHVPFTGNQRKARKDARLLAEKQANRERDSELNAYHYQNQNKLANGLKEGDDGTTTFSSDLKEKNDYDSRVDKSKKSKYLTDDYDDEDAQNEVEISRNIDTAYGLSQDLKKQAQLISSTLDSQNDRLKKISEKVDKVDDKLTVTTGRLRGI